jgi:hypothetical protein
MCNNPRRYTREKYDANVFKCAPNCHRPSHNYFGLSLALLQFLVRKYNGAIQEDFVFRAYVFTKNREVLYSSPLA